MKHTQSIQLNAESACTLDVQTFSAAIEASSAENPDPLPLERALVLYQGDFLEGFAIKDGSDFDDWVLIVRERLQRQASTAIQRLTAHYEHVGDYNRACDYAWRQVELERWQEQAHRQLMRLLALNGKRSEALAQYEVCRRILAEELAVEPTRETITLYEQIRDDKLWPMDIALSSDTIREPAFLAQERPIESEKGVFVARERELVRLEHYLKQALDGQGKMVFITGEAGQGKTSLIQAFACQAQETYPELVVADGNCNAYTGVGDPYLPFREMLELLTGDVRARWTSGAISREHARSLWHGLPYAAQALLDGGPDLLNILIPSVPLLKRAATCGLATSWLDRLRALVEDKTVRAGASPPRQDTLFEQYTTVLHTLARRAPLLLVVDDLQWVDFGSASLLFHLGRRLAGQRILILGAYRPEEVASGRRDPGTGKWERHPLETIINEFKRDWGDIEVNLAQVEGRHFVQALLDSEPHRLGADFCETLYRRTEGHPLFTVELLRGMQERGGLVQDEEGCWVEGSVLDWNKLPARVEAVIAERIGRLSRSSQDMLRIASVEGEVFTAEVVAQAVDTQAIIPILSGELDRRYHLIHAQGVEQMADQRLSRYRFRHILFQTYIYQNLDAAERAYLHQKVGDTLLVFYGEHAQTIAPHLAWHFEQAGMTSEAVGYYQQAGARAIQMAANAEAIAHLNKGIALLQTLPPSTKRDERELAMQLALTVPTMASKSWAAPEIIQACDRAMELSQRLNDIPKLLQAMMLKQSAHSTRAEHRPALEVAEQFYRLGQGDNPVQTMLGHQGLGVTCLFVGDFSRSLNHMRQLMALYDFEAHRSLAFVLGQDPAIVSLLIRLYDLWYLGYPDQAFASSEEGFALAQDLEHPFSLLFFLGFKIRLHRWRREVTEVQRLADIEMDLWHEYKMGLAKAGALQARAWVHAEQGHPEEAIAMYKAGLDAWYATGMRNHYTEWLSVLADMHGKAGQPEQGLDLIEEALAFMQESDERYHEAELYRMRGLLRLQQDENNAEEAENDFAEADFRHSIAAARRMEARMCELRTTVCLARLWQQQGKHEQARERLVEIYGWFTEGFDTLDLQEAKALLDALA